MTSIRAAWADEPTVVVAFSAHPGAVTSIRAAWADEPAVVVAFSAHPGAVTSIRAAWADEPTVVVGFSAHGGLRHAAGRPEILARPEPAGTMWRDRRRTKLDPGETRA